MISSNETTAPSFIIARTDNKFLSKSGKYSMSRKDIFWSILSYIKLFYCMLELNGYHPDLQQRVA